MSTEASPPVCVVVGSGSAGRRHARALRALAPDHRIVVVRRPSSTQPIDELGEVGVELVDDVASAAALEPLLSVVAGPATTHAPAVVALLPASRAVLVEKPLAADLVGGRAIDRAAHETGRPIVVGYHLRFDELVRRFIDEARRLAVTTFELRVGQHLAGWRPMVPASTSVSARADLGGGVLRELSHEIDAAIAAFGPVDAVRAEVRRDGAPTDGIVDTVADLEVQMASGAIGRIHLDMVSDPAFRTWSAVGERGALTADLLTGTLEGAGAPIAVAPGWRDRAEHRLVAHALAVAGGGVGPACGVADGLRVLEVIEAAEESTASGELVPVRSVRARREGVG